LIGEFGAETTMKVLAIPLSALAARSSMWFKLLLSVRAFADFA
jgi:hypothetical protein